MAKTAQTTLWKATDKDYRKFAGRIHEVMREIKGLNGDIKQIKHEAVQAGCNPRVLSALIKLDVMKSADKDALHDALDM